MPLYAYKCSDCEHQFEIRQKFSDDPLSVCPKCNGHIRRVISRVGIVFKGSGFYVTDNRNGKANGKVGSVSADKDTSTAEKADSDGEKKPAADDKDKATKAAKSKSASTSASAGSAA
jgi:putative FmdB family regulatory protein